MTFGRAAPMAGRLMRPAGAAALLAGLAGCGQFGDPLEAIGLRVPPPDEFQVVEYEPLVVPEAYTLPEPRPGEPSPRAPTPGRDAVAALYGPEVAARAAAAGPSEGERALLSAAEAGSASGDIRVQLEEEKRQARAGQPYEPPLLWDVLGLTDEDDASQIDESEIVDPVAEAERLQRQGIQTPVDPEAEARARAEAEREAREAEAEPVVTDRRPTNRIGPPPEPAF